VAVAAGVPRAEQGGLGHGHQGGRERVRLLLLHEQRRRFLPNGFFFLPRGLVVPHVRVLLEEFGLLRASETKNR
jgi:hypothetical protein